MTTIDQVVAAHEALAVAVENYTTAYKGQTASRNGRFSAALEEAQEDSTDQAKKTMWDRFKAFLARIREWFKKLFSKQEEEGKTVKDTSEKISENAEKLKKSVADLEKSRQAVAESFKGMAKMKVGPEASGLGAVVRGTLIKQLADNLSSTKGEVLKEAFATYLAEKINANASVLDGVNQVLKDGNGDLSGMLAEYGSFYKTVAKYLSDFDAGLKSGNLSNVKAPEITVPNAEYKGGNEKLTPADVEKAIVALRKQLQAIAKMGSDGSILADAQKTMELLEKLENASPSENLVDPNGAFREMMNVISEKLVPFRVQLLKYQNSSSIAVVAMGGTDLATVASKGKVFASKREELEAAAKAFYESKKAFEYDSEVFDAALDELHSRNFQKYLFQMIG